MQKHNPPVILLVEDDPDHQELFKANLHLTSFAHADVHCVNTLAKARNYLNDSHADLVFLDLSLPDSTIAETLDSLSKLTEKVPVIVSTSSDDKRIILDVINKGADDCLPKSEMDDVMLERMIRFTIDRWQLRESLKNSQQKLNLALSHALIGVWDFDPINDVLVWDDSMYKVYGIKPENFSGAYDAWRNSLHPEDLIRAEAELRTALEGGGDLDTDFRISTEDGETRHLKAKGKVFFDADGKATRMVGMNWDITRQIVAAQQLADLNQQYRALFMDSPDAYLVMEIDGGRIADCNCAAERMLHGSRDAIIGMTPDVLSPLKQPDGRFSLEVVPEKIKQAVETGYNRFEWVHRRLDGENFWVEVTISVIDFQSRKALLVAWRDITERKQLELNLKYHQNTLKLVNQRLKLLNRLIEGSGDPFYVLDVNDGYRMIFANAAACQHYGLSKEQLLTKRVPDWDLDVDLDKLAELRVLLINEGHATITTRHRVASGEIIPVEVSISYLKDDSGEYMYGIFNDIRQKLSMENAMREAKELAERSARTRSEFLANMSHEIRTPMNAILGLSHLALNKVVSDEVRDYLYKINTSSESLLGILNDILDFSKIEAGKLQIDQQRFDLDAVLENVQNLFANHAVGKGLTFAIEVAADVPVDLLGDALRLQQILSNLLGNAIKFTEHGRVLVEITTLETEKSKARLHFCVSDTGIGMSQHDVAKLFQPFSQVDGSASRRFGGTGLGLAISRNLLQLMGSELYVHSTLGEGSRFEFELVLSVASHKQHQQVSTRHQMHKAGELAQYLGGRGKPLAGVRVLLAEDNRINQQVVEEFLKLAGMHVDVANNGKEALALLEQKTYDAVLMDVHMPEMDGIEATTIIRKNPRFDGLPIFALTAGATLEERVASMECGMNDFITKPVSPAALIDKLSAWIHPEQTKDPAPRRAGEPQSTASEISKQPSAGSTQTPLKPPANADWPEIPGIDAMQACKAMFGDQALFVELLKVYTEENEELMEKLKQQLAAQNWKEVANVAHKLKGQTAYIGAKPMTDAAIALEKAAKAEDDNITALADSVFSINARLVAAVQLWLRSS